MNYRRQFDRPTLYHVRIKGTLDHGWSEWFEGFAIIPQADDETLLAGMVADQADLYGLLKKVFDLGFVLVMVQRDPGHG